METNYIQELITSGVEVSVFVDSGIQQKGTIEKQDDKSIVLDSKVSTQLIYKDKISSICEYKGK